MSEVLRAGAQLIRNIRKNKSEISLNRKSLQALQPSATDFNLLVPSPNMVNRAGKEISEVLDSTFTIPKYDSLEKENALVVRQSKRKNVVLDGQLKKGSSKEDAAPATKSRKAKSSKAVSKSKKAPASKTLPDASQCRLDSFSFVSVAPNSNEHGKMSPDVDNCTSVNEGILCLDPKVVIPMNGSAEEENATVGRRSKRKNAALDELPTKGSPKQDAAPATKSQKSKSSKAVSKVKKAPVAKKPGKKLPDVNQPSLNSFVSATSKSNEIGESTADGNNSTLVGEDLTVCVYESVSDKMELLTSDVPSETYWKDIAEQRRLALEQALYENAQLVDQLEVIEAENGQLKSMLKECEKVIEIVNASM